MLQPVRAAVAWEAGSAAARAAARQQDTGSWEPCRAVAPCQTSRPASPCSPQLTALAYRPLKSVPARRYWNWGHWWIGRGAAACAIGDIY